MGAAETRRAIEAAERALPAGAASSPRSARKSAALASNSCSPIRRRLAQIITAEQGKPIAEARGEIAYGALISTGSRKRATRLWRMSRSMGRKAVFRVQAADRRDRGDHALELPLRHVARKAGAALAAGCTIVVKPAELTPLSAIALAEIAQRAGVPDGVLNVVTTNDPSSVGVELASNPAVRKITFTGSTEVGKILLRQARRKCAEMLDGAGRQRAFDRLRGRRSRLAVKGAMATKYRNAARPASPPTAFWRIRASREASRTSWPKRRRRAEGRQWNRCGRGASAR